MLQSKLFEQQGIILNMTNFSAANLLFDPAEVEMMGFYNNTVISNCHHFSIL